MSWRRNVRGLIRRCGYDLTLWPAADGLYASVQLMQHLGVDHVLDVGANDGIYARRIRALGYSGRITSFEPLRSAYDGLVASAHRDDAWNVRNVAVGPTNGRVILNVAANDGASSSVLPMLDRHSAAAPEANYVGTETVEQVALSDLLSEFSGGGSLYLKLDIQGYEGVALESVGRSISRVRVLQVETSLTPLYSGAWGWAETLAYANEVGFRLVGIDPAFSDPSTGELLQADLMFARS